MKNKKLLDSLFVPVTIIVGKLFTFIFDALLVAYYGASEITDAFILAHALPTILFDGVANAIIVCFIPIYQKIKNEDENQINAYCNNTLVLAIFIGVIVSLLFTLLRSHILGFYAKGVSPLSFMYLEKFSRIVIWAIPFISAYSVFNAFLQTNGSKSLGNISQIITYIVLIITIILSYPAEVFLAYFTVIGNILVFILLANFSMDKGWKFSYVFNIKDEYIKFLLISAVPIFVSSLLSEINAIVDKYYASFYATGIITSMTYGYKLGFAIQGIIASAVMIMLFPELAKFASQGALEKLGEMTSLAIRVISYFQYPIVIGGILYSQNIIQLVFGHGNFNVEDVTVTAKIFKIYLLGVIPMSIKHVGDKLCYSLQKNNFALYASIASIICNIILNQILSAYFGYIGLAYATGLSLLIGCIVIFLFIYRYNHKILKKELFLSIVQPLIPSFIMLAILLISNELFINQLSKNNFLYLIVSIAVGAVSYIASVLIFQKNYLKKSIK